MRLSLRLCHGRFTGPGRMQPFDPHGFVPNRREMSQVLLHPLDQLGQVREVDDEPGHVAALRLVRTDSSVAAYPAPDPRNPPASSSNAPSIASTPPSHCPHPSRKAAAAAPCHPAVSSTVAADRNGSRADRAPTTAADSA